MNQLTPNSIAFENHAQRRKRPLKHQRKYDQFYTCDSVAKACMRRLYGYLDHQNPYYEYFFIEPSAGRGAFSRLLPPGSLAFDIDPQCDSIERMNFFDARLPNYEGTVVVGNPPFGRNSSTAIKIFNHAARRADTIAFILPKTFQKDSVVRRLNPNFCLFREWPIPDDAFIFDGKRVTVPCVFQIWRRGFQLRRARRYPTTHSDFDFCKSSEAHFGLRRVGANVGKIHHDFGQSESSNYFLKAKHSQVEEILSAIDFRPIASRTAGNPSLAKTELIKLYVEMKEHLRA